MTKSKYERALEALRFIGEGGLPNIGQDETYAAQVYAELTAPRMETVTGWINIYPDIRTGIIHNTRSEADASTKGGRIDCIEITYSRPIEEKEDVWEGVVAEEKRPGFIHYYVSGSVENLKPHVGKTVEVRLKEGE